MTEKASVTHELIKPFESFAFTLTCLNGVFKLFLYQNSKVSILFLYETALFMCVLLITAKKSLRIISVGRFIRLSSRQSCRQFVFTIYAIA